MKLDQDLCLNLFELWYAELNPRVRCAFGNVFCTENVVDVPSVGTADFSGLGWSRKISRRPSVGHRWRKYLAFGDIYLTCRGIFLTLQEQLIVT